MTGKAAEDIDMATSNGNDAAEVLWKHADPESTNMYAFLQSLNKKYTLDLKTYEELYDWSVNNVAAFWGEVWHWVGIRASESYDQIVDAQAPIFPRPAFFTGAKLNFAENLLFPTQEVEPSSEAIIAATETARETVTWAQLRERVRLCQASLAATGLEQGDRVAGYVANHTNAVVAMLAATSLGAIWTAVSPDTGVQAVLDRLQQIEPKVLFSDNASLYNGKSYPVIPKLKEICAGIETLETVVVFNTVPSEEVDLSSVKLPELGSACFYESFLSLGPPSWILKFTQLDPDHPVYILYSSGTTGAPKCIVHGAIGTLIQHKKEHIIHSSLTPSSRLFYFTTCTWMMWHWLVSGLSCGATLVIYDGSPFRSPDPIIPEKSHSDDLAMPRLIEELKITHFGTSAKYLSVLEQKALIPTESLDLSSLTTIFSTGSPLAPSTFQYVYRAFPPSVLLASITGGTDIVSLFGAPCPLLPVRAGVIQAPGLGMAIRAYDYMGEDVTGSGEPGDLVCTRAFPCQPVAFWGVNGEEKYRKAYFAAYDDLDSSTDKVENGDGETNGTKKAEKRAVIWHHGDFVRFVPNPMAEPQGPSEDEMKMRTPLGLIMLGRSDGVLKPSGVRFGSAEIYNILLAHFPSIEDALCIGRRRETDSDETVILFVKMASGNDYTDELASKIKTRIKEDLSVRHVPGVIDVCEEIPVTTNGKKIEGAVKQILCGIDVKTSATVANKECLEWYREWAKTH